MQGDKAHRYKTSEVPSEGRERSKRWGTVVVYISTVLLIVYALSVSVSVFFVYCDYTVLKSRIQTLEARIQTLEGNPVAAEARPAPLGRRKDDLGSRTRSEAGDAEVRQGGDRHAGVSTAR